MPPSLFKAALLGATLPLLSGCIAAVVPLAAGGALLGRDDEEDIEEQAVDAVPATEIPDEAAIMPPEPDPVVIVGPAEEVEAEASDGFVVEQQEDVVDPATKSVPADANVPETPVESAVTQPTSDSAELPSVSASDPNFIGPPSEEVATPPAADEPSQVKENELPVEPVTATPVEPQQSDSTEQPEPAQEPVAPPPAEPETTIAAAAPDPAPTTLPAPIDFRAYDVFYGYVEQQARRDPVSDARQSALLASPGSLSPRRTECSIRPPAVLIDLDPAGSAISLTGNQTPDPALTQILLSLRLQEIDVFWISERPALDAGAIRRALVQSGLDPQGRDGLLLMRREDDRKQTRREELGETHCLLAIAGDDRADFDELYLYLKDTSAAQPLEELIGAGWFLTPLPLTEGR